MKDTLKDLVVLELASVLAGPSVGMFLAELGAQVIKVEHFAGGGDVTRTWKLPTEDPQNDRSAYFSSVNWGKRSIGIDLRLPEGRAIVHAIAGKADVVIASYKPGDAQKLQVDATTLMALNPRLIYADLTAYGDDDPRVGFDAIIQAEAGFTYINGEPASGPTKMPVALMDVLAAHQLKEGILLALITRSQTQRGTHVRTNLLGAGLASLANQAANWLVGGVVPQRIGSGHPNIVPYGNSYATLDGREIVLAVGNDAQFQRLCNCLALPALAADARFAGNADRVRNREALNTLLREAIAHHGRDALLAALHAVQVPAGAVHDMREACATPQAADLRLQGPHLAGMRTVALAGLEGLQLDEPPAMAADTRQVLQDFLGYSAAQIDSLKLQKAIL
ncbi:MAG TPA: CaiB/BaiF CoA-transferase family protein [Bacteroidia bacterium]|nr:CaiB/BaiF CoA-transferase family protein [Bacteroidia bacterium]